MGRSERAKGVAGEREVAVLLERNGYTVRGLEGSGDWLAFRGGAMLHVETKRQENARPWLWIAQAEAEAPEGALPVIAFRRSRMQWWAMTPLERMLARLDRFST